MLSIVAWESIFCPVCKINMTDNIAPNSAYVNEDHFVIKLLHSN
jgi:hypothetical protein